MPRKRKLPEGMYQRGRHYYADFYAGGHRVSSARRRTPVVYTTGTEHFGTF